MQAKFTVLVLNGPNLNMLGKREPEIYGHKNLTQVMTELSQLALAKGAQLSHFQSNAEHLLIDAIHNAYQNIDFIIINPAALTHTSIALRDAILSVSIPFIEVHLSNIHAREKFRHHSYFSDIAQAVICGLGAKGYNLALDSALDWLNKNNQT